MAYSQMDVVESIQVADPDEAARARLGAKFPSANIMSDYRVILEKPDVEIVDVSVPHYLHKPIVIEAIQAGKHVLCEKPIATNVSDAKDMVDAARANGVKLCILLNQMFAPAHRKAKEMIENDVIGRPFMGVWNMMGDALRKMRMKESWKGDKEKAGGGALIDTGMHAAYVLLDLFGKPARVSAFARRLIVEHENKGDDNSVVCMEFASGAVVSYAQSYAVTTEPWNEKKHIYGTRGSLHIDDTSVESPLLLCTDRAKPPAPVEIDRPALLWEDTIRRCIEHHVSHILHSTPLLYETELAIQALELMLACYESSETGCAVEVGA
jgi:predicted dehydrogenase